MEHWESYYRRGVLVSCPMDTNPGYTQEVRQTWVDFFSGLKTGDRLVDLGTGNGAVLLIAQETARSLGHNPEIHGVDLARIDPKRDVPNGETLFAGVNFHPQVNMESLPFEDASLTAVCGHYSLEYADVPNCLAELRRVLTVTGRAQFVLHHPDSIVVTNARESLAQGDLVFKQAKVFRKFRRFCERQQTTPQRCQSVLQDLRQAGDLLRTAVGRSNNPLFLKCVLESLGVLFEQSRGLPHQALLEQVNETEKEFRRWLHRLRDLATAAVSEVQMDEFVSKAQTLGFRDSSASLQTQQSHLIGWCWRFRGSRA